MLYNNSNCCGCGSSCGGSCGCGSCGGWGCGSNGFFGLSCGCITELIIIAALFQLFGCCWGPGPAANGCGCNSLATV